MNNSLQLNLHLASQEQVRLSWAFADRGQVITSCSRQAKELGVYVGMKYEDAKALLPELRVIMLRGRRNANRRTNSRIKD